MLGLRIQPLACLPPIFGVLQPCLTEINIATLLVLSIPSSAPRHGPSAWADGQVVGDNLLVAGMHSMELEDALVDESIFG